MKKNALIIIGVFIGIVILGILMYYTTDQKQEENKIFINNYLNELGYKYDEKEKLFKKITTDNTLDEFYDLSKEELGSFSL